MCWPLTGSLSFVLHMLRWRMAWECQSFYAKHASSERSLYAAGCMHVGGHAASCAWHAHQWLEANDLKVVGGHYCGMWAEIQAYIGILARMSFAISQQPGMHRIVDSRQLACASGDHRAPHLFFMLVDACGGCFLNELVMKPAGADALLVWLAPAALDALAFMRLLRFAKAMAARMAFSRVTLSSVALIVAPDPCKAALGLHSTQNTSLREQ